MLEWCACANRVRRIVPRVRGACRPRKSSHGRPEKRPVIRGKVDCPGNARLAFTGLWPRAAAQRTKRLSARPLEVTLLRCRPAAACCLDHPFLGLRKLCACPTLALKRRGEVCEKCEKSSALAALRSPRRGRTRTRPPARRRRRATPSRPSSGTRRPASRRSSSCPAG